VCGEQLDAVGADRVDLVQDEREREGDVAEGGDDVPGLEVCDGDGFGSAGVGVLGDGFPVGGALADLGGLVGGFRGGRVGLLCCVPFFPTSLTIASGD
jgi:hypothetical protein